MQLKHETLIYSSEMILQLCCIILFIGVKSFSYRAG